VQTIVESAPEAVKYLRDVSRGEEKPEALRMEACKYLINQALGMPRQRQDIDLAADGLVKIQVIYDKPLPEIESPGTEIIEIQPQ
jgi:hypothetical protein